MNKTAVILGSSVNLGKEIALEYARNGYNTVITYLNHEKEAIETGKFIESNFNVKTLISKCDIRSEEDLKLLLNKIKSNFDSLDVLINNAAINMDNSFEEKTKDEFLSILETNLVGPFLSSKILGEYMKEFEGSSIINISSNNGIDSFYVESLDYDASKAGLINLTHNLANYFAPFVRVNAVCPGWFLTNQSINPFLKENEEKKILLNRYGTMNEIAKVVYFLGSENASYINDAVIKVDGGKRC